MSTSSSLGLELEANQELDRLFVEGMSRKDLGQVMQCFWNNPDLIVVLFDGTVCRGWDEVRGAVSTLFSTFTSVQLEINEITHLPLGDGVVAVGTATFRLQPKDGPVQVITERWTDVRRKVDGRWVYVLDHAHALAPS